MSHIQELYKKGKQESSPTSLDNLILNAAKQSCEKPVISKTKKWLYALPTAAVVMLSLSLLINLQHENQDMMLTPTTKVSAPKAPVENDKKELQLGELKRELSTKPIEKHTEPNKPRKEKSSTTLEQENYMPMPEIMTTKDYKPNAQKLKSSNYSQSKDNAKYSTGFFGRTDDLEKSDNITNTEERVSEEPIADMTTANIIIPESSEAKKEQQRSKRLSKLDSSSKSKKRPSTLQAEILKVEQLIKEKKYEQAQKILKTLKLNYPLYDFSDLESKLVYLPKT